MGKKKKKDKEEVKPWCFYCDRLFDNEATLIQHQKAKHFRCAECNRKLNTAQGLAVHSYQVHKVTVSSVPGAKPGREGMDIEVFGMAGVPPGLKPGGSYEPEPASKKAKVTEAAPVSLPAVGASAPGMYMAQPPLAPPMPFMAPSPAGQPMPYSTGYPPYGQPPPYPAYPNGPPSMGPPPFGPRPAMFMGGPPPPGMAMPPPYGGPRFPAPGPQMGMPPGAPLFPVADLQPVRPSSTPLFPIGGPAAEPALQTGSSSAQPLTDATLVWTDEDFSVEERRAQNPQYANHTAF